MSTTMNGNKYFSILSHIFSIQEQIDELMKGGYTNEILFMRKMKKRVDMLEKFTVKNWIQYKKDEESRS